MIINPEMSIECFKSLGPKVAEHMRDFLNDRYSGMELDDMPEDVFDNAVDVARTRFCDVIQFGRIADTTA